MVIRCLQEALMWYVRTASDSPDDDVVGALGNLYLQRAMGARDAVQVRGVGWEEQDGPGRERGSRPCKTEWPKPIGGLAICPSSASTSHRGAGIRRRSQGNVRCWSHRKSIAAC